MLTRSDIKTLRNNGNSKSLSIYIPTEITGDYEKNRILWKNACAEAQEVMSKKGITNISLEEAEKLDDNPEFWANQSQSLVGFFSEDFSKVKHLSSKVPKSMVTLGDEFYLLPSWNDWTSHDRVFVLALSENEVRFFEAVNSGIYPVIIEDVVPRDMATSLNLDITGNCIQSHQSGSAIFHGNDSGDDKENIRLQQYFRDIDKGLLSFIHDEKVPLIIAGTTGHHAAYSAVSSYKYISKHVLIGNPENLSAAEIRMQVQPVFDEIKQKRVDQMHRQFNESTSDLKLTNPSEIVDFAKQNNIKALFINSEYLNEMAESYKMKFNNILLDLEQMGGDVLIGDNEALSKDIIALKRF